MGQAFGRHVPRGQGLTIRSSGPLRRSAVLSCRGQQRPLNSSVRCLDARYSHSSGRPYLFSCAGDCRVLALRSAGRNFTGPGYSRRTFEGKHNQGFVSSGFLVLCDFATDLHCWGQRQPIRRSHSPFQDLAVRQRNLRFICRAHRPNFWALFPNLHSSFSFLLNLRSNFNSGIVRRHLTIRSSGPLRVARGNLPLIVAAATYLRR